MAGKKWRAQEVLFAVCFRSPFKLRRYQAVVPNVSWGFFRDREADLILVSKSGYITEIEIKVTAADLRQDRLKRKWLTDPSKDRVKEFYYALPESVWSKIDPQEVRPEAGIITVSDRGRAEVIRPPAVNRHAEPLTIADINRLLRLCCLKYWTRFWEQTRVKCESPPTDVV